MMAKGDKISGGLTDNWTVEDVAKKHSVSIDEIKKELEKGTGIELEHTNNKGEAKEIALDHLYEFPDYYTRLDNMENKAEKDMEKKENITEYARRMRELAGLSEGKQSKSLNTIQEGTSSFEGGVTFMAKDFMTSNDNAESRQEAAVNEAKEKEDEKDNKDDEFETHKFEQRPIEEGENDKELYNLNENTIIVLDFLDEEEK